MPEAQVSWEGAGGEGGLGYLRLLFEHFEILDISQTFNLQMQFFFSNRVLFLKILLKQQ